MRNDLEDLMSGSASPNVISLVSRPGWTGPVLAAHSSASGLGSGLAKRTRRDLRSIEGSVAAVKAQQGEITRAAEALVAEMRERGKRFGLQVFGDRLKELQDAATASPEILGDLPAVLHHFQVGAATIVAVHIEASAGRGSTAPAFAHMQAARAVYGEHVLRFAFDILAKLAGDLGLAAVPAEWADDVSDAILAFVFPGDGDAPKDDAWRQAFTVRFDAIRDQARECRAVSGRS
ncbi:hypothetical protein [Aureimonas sp. ME7]|uniref:hypothetical protein n=1 Tax=Aureimonas sp. ME7 TaxID=2744252 RepID=UPI0015F78EEC|nr:hypothetical protein [Aureimonas sp. ME7]